MGRDLEAVKVSRGSSPRPPIPASATLGRPSPPLRGGREAPYLVLLSQFDDEPLKRQPDSPPSVSGANGGEGVEGVAPLRHSRMPNIVDAGNP
jgi:hypothetical protein